jgi:hypothetical protein
VIAILHGEPVRGSQIDPRLTLGPIEGALIRYRFDDPSPRSVCNPAILSGLKQRITQVQSWPNRDSAAGKKARKRVPAIKPDHHRACTA